jgi:cytidylate kinase
MSPQTSLPKLITFDGEARSGKGTIVQATKDALRDTYGYNVMLIDAGQVFRCLVVAAGRAGIDLDNPDAIDAFLSDDQNAENCVQFVKDVYNMQKAERDKLLYTNQVGADSAKIGARPLSQTFKDELLRKWLRDAHADGFEVVLLDGRALEETGRMLESQGLCEFVAGLYFLCDPVVGAMRTLGHANRRYDVLTTDQRADVDLLVTQIIARNDADRNRAVQPIVQPNEAPVFVLPTIDDVPQTNKRFMATIDTSAQISKEQMSEPVIRLLATVMGIDKT